MVEVHLKLEPDHMPKTTAELVDYLRTMSCVDYDTGIRRMPNFVDDQVFDGAADLIEAQEAELKRLRAALEEIINPIEAMRQQAADEGSGIDGLMAITLANDPEYLRAIARATLSATGSSPSSTDGGKNGG